MHYILYAITFILYLNYKKSNDRFIKQVISYKFIIYNHYYLVLILNLRLLNKLKI